MHQHLAQCRGCAGRQFNSDNLTTAAAFQRGFKFAHKVFCFFFNFQITVAQNAKQALPNSCIAGKDRIKTQQHKVFDRQETHSITGHADKTVNLRGDRQQGLQGFFIAAALKLQGK